MMRKESKADSFQRQISALRQQLGGDDETPPPFDDAEAMPEQDEAVVVAPTPRAGAQISYVNANAPTTSWPAVDANVGVVAADSLWDGKLHTTGSLHVYGQVLGELSAEHEIWVAAGAEVRANVRAVNLIVSGLVDGTVVCDGRLEVRPGGQVAGDVTAPTLVVEDGATLTGTLRMQAPNGAR
jgi:cytoskeletal protein CcmA (bactofilin family)